MIESIPVLRNISFITTLLQPAYLYALVIGLVSLVWLCLNYYNQTRKQYRLSKRKMQLEELLADFNPEPLIPPSKPDNEVGVAPIIKEKLDVRNKINNKLCLNLVTSNYLNLLINSEIESKSIQAIEKFGVGSCGPRGFYGTVVVHLDLEQRIAKFMNMEDTIVYSYGFSTIASTIPAYCKHHDIIFCDSKISDSARCGITAARSKCVFFEHNNAADLEKKVKLNCKTNNPRQRKFLVLEGIYGKTGELCDLPNMVKIRKNHQMRLFLDESNSIGILGATGRGALEHFGIHQSEVDIIMGSLENLMGSVGGFCVGSHFIIEHQRLSGLGYCFSASLPPVLTRSAILAIDYLDSQPHIFNKIRSCSEKLHGMLMKIDSMKVYGNKIAPVKYLEFLNSYTKINKDDYKLFVEKCQADGVLVQLCSYSVSDNLRTNCSIRIYINIALTEDDMKIIINVINSAASSILNKLYK